MGFMTWDYSEVSHMGITTNTLYLVGLISGLFITAWISTFLILRGKDEQMKAFMQDGNLVKLLTVAIVVVAASFLALLGVFTVGIAGLFGSIAGFVLGSIGRRGSA